MSADTDREESFTGGYRWGLIAERQRIIALLRETIRDDEGEGLCHPDEDGDMYVLNMNALIRIIKGETK